MFFEVFNIVVYDCWSSSHDYLWCCNDL